MTDASAEEPDPFEVLEPRRSVWSIATAVLVALLVAGTVWVSPALTTVDLKSDDQSGGGWVPSGLDANMAWTSIQVNAIGGVTIGSIDSVGPKKAAGAWVLDELQMGSLDKALTSWMTLCAPDGVIDGSNAACQLPTGAAQAPALLQALDSFGAPLDASTALPKHLPNGLRGSIVAIWVSQCGDDESGGTVSPFTTVRTKRFGVPGAVTITLPCYPS